jgi:two-component system chemotaxis response regulator CheB
VAISALVVDDSALVRQVLSAILGQGGMEVATAPDAFIAFDKIKRSRPDVIVLDVQMPGMDGLTFLRRLMVRDPIPVVICSGLAHRGTHLGVRALDEGAVDIVGKPVVGIEEFLQESAVMLIETVRGAAQARLRAPRPRPPRIAPSRIVRPAGGAVELVVLGASTGGTEALREILTALPADAPALAVVQHMPEHFTRTFAERLNADCAIEVKEAQPGDQLRPGRALLAPGNWHLRVRRQRGELTVDLDQDALVSRHRPSVDVLFESAAASCGRSTLGILLTGMGSDGAAGMVSLRQAGGQTIAQDEATCVVFGMPREAIERGAAVRILPLYGIAEAILSARAGQG